MRLVYFGSGAFGLPTFKTLVEHHDVALVVTQPDKPAGRKLKLKATPIAELAAQRALVIIRPSDVNESGVVKQIRAIKPDALVVVAYGHKLRRELLQDSFAINLHASLLPKYRGAAPIHWAMINGETETGVSVIKVADRIDAGDVLRQCATTIDPMETAGELHDRLAELGPNLVLAVLSQQENGTMNAVRQDDGLATHAPKLSKVDGTVRFDQPAIRVQQRIHGLTPWPGCTIKLDGRLLRLARAKSANQITRHSHPGEVLSDYSIACAEDLLHLLEVQPPGGKVMSFTDYRNGQPVRVGSRCEPV